MSGEDEDEFDYYLSSDDKPKQSGDYANELFAKLQSPDNSDAAALWRKLDAKWEEFDREGMIEEPVTAFHQSTTYDFKYVIREHIEQSDVWYEHSAMNETWQHYVETTLLEHWLINKAYRAAKK